MSSINRDIYATKGCNLLSYVHPMNRRVAERGIGELRKGSRKQSTLDEARQVQQAGKKSIVANSSRRAIQKYKQAVKQIQLSGGFGLQGGSATFVDFLLEHPVNQLYSTFDLSNTSIVDVFLIEALIPFLESDKSNHLEYLNLWQTRITIHGVTALAKILPRSKLKKIRLSNVSDLPLDVFNEKTKILNLNGKQLKIYDAICIGGMLDQDCIALDIIELSCNLLCGAQGVGLAGLTVLCTAIDKAQLGLKILRFVDIMIEQSCTDIVGYVKMHYIPMEFCLYFKYCATRSLYCIRLI